MVLRSPVSIASIPPIPWKNGGGTTRNLVVAPQGAGLSEFLFRASLAEVHASGAFSCFPEVDRTILLWSGRGMVLHSPQWPVHALTEPLQPFCFRGEDEVRAILAGGPSSDLNIMVRRGHAVATVHVCTCDVVLDDRDAECVLICSSGAFGLQNEGEADVILHAGDFLHISSMPGGLCLRPAGADAKLVCAVIKRLQGGVA